MQGRAPVAVAVSAVMLAWMPGPASAQTPVSWKEAAAMAEFPVLEPVRAFGLSGRVTVERNYCEAPGKVTVRATYGRRSGKGPQLQVLEAHPSICGDAGQYTRYRKARVRGRAVWVYAACEVTGGRCRPVAGTRSWLLRLRLRTGTPRRLTAVGLIGSGVSLRRFVRAARSLRDVAPAASVPLSEFLSSDGSIWCRIGRYEPADRFCVSHGGADEYGAAVSLDGTVRFCGAGQPDPYAECTQTWNPSALRLKDGLSSDLGGYVCTEQGGAMTCTVNRGPGFRVSATGSEAVAGAP